VTKTDLSRILGVSIRHTGNLVAQGLIVLHKRGGVDVPRTLAVMFKAAQERSAARRGRDDLTRLQIAAAQIRADRVARKWLSVEETEAIFAFAMNKVAELATGEAAKLYAELTMDCPEMIARTAATRMEERTRGLFLAMRNAVTAMVKDSLSGHLSQRDRIDVLLARYMQPPGGSDDEKIQIDKDKPEDEAAKAATSATTSEEATDRAAARGRGRASRTAKNAAVKGPSR